ncbi:hypothetical protein EON80_19920 [bacterium]|nr:MAG: hypothetical protein EON80_19920 [bacterium]
MATRKGSAVAEKWTREGHFRFEVKGFSVTRQLSATLWSVEMRVPLTPVNGATRFRFNALRRTTVNGARITGYALTESGDPYEMGVIEVKPSKNTPNTQLQRAKPASRAKISGAQKGNNP